MRQVIFWLRLCFLVVVLTGEVAAQTGDTVPTLDTIIARMAQARAENQACFRSYVVTRDYRLFGRDRDRFKAQVIADITFTPPDTKQYTIQKADGSRLGKSIVRRTLAGEVDIAKDYALTDFSTDNYDFRFTRVVDLGGRPSYELELLPKREDKSLLRGIIWIDSATYLPGRIEAEPAKSPSWWLRDVNVTLLYGGVSGMWLQTRMEVTANVRILGPYLMISKDVEYRISEPVVASCRELDQGGHMDWDASAPPHPSADIR